MGRFVAICSLFSVAVGLAGLAGWVFQIEILKAVLPGLVTMKANTAACFVLIGFSLWWLGAHGKPSRSVSRWIAKAAAALVSAVGLLSFMEFLGGWNFGIDQLLFVETAQGAVGSIRPGLMSPITALAFVLLGTALLLLDWTRDREVSPSQSLAFGVGLICLFVLLDFIVHPAGSHTGMALHTAIALCLLSIGVVCSRPERGFVRTLLSADFRSGTVRGLWAAVLSEDGPAWRRPLRYGLAVLLVFLATVVPHIPGGFLPERLTYLTFYPAAMIAALLGGLGPGIVATLLSGVCVDYFFLEPKGQFGNKGLPDLMGLIVFLSIGIGMSWLAGAVERTRKSASAALRASENRYRTLIENLPQMVFVKDRASVYGSCNQSFARSLGIRPEEYAGKTDYDFFPAELAEKYRSDDQRVMESGTTEEIEEKYIRDGKELSVQTVKTPIRDAAGNVIGILGIFWDVTERKRVQEQLRKSSLYARSLIEASLDPLVTISREGKITDVNEATERVTGVSRERLIGSDFSNYFTDPESARRGYEQVFAQGAVQDYPLAIRSAAGKVTDVLYNASVFRNESGEVEGVFAAARDVTERKRAEEEVLKASLYARSLIEASLDPLVTISREGKITDVNEATEKVTGISRGHLIGSDFSDYFTQPEKARQGYRQVFAEGTVRDYPLAIRHNAGSITDVLYNATVFKNEVGEIEGVFAAARDITEKKRAQEAVAAEREKFNNILDVLPPYVVLLTPDYHVAFANHEFKKRFGESNGRRCFEFLFNRSEPCEVCETYKVLQAKKALEWKWTGPDGRHYDIYDFPFTDTDGSTLILEMGIDVTERKLAEAALQESETNFRALSELVPQLVWACMPDGLNVYFNQRWVEYTGLTLEESYGRGWNTPFHPDDKQPAWDAWNHAVATGDTYRVESRLRATDGSYRWFLMRGVPLHDASGSIVKWFGTCTDIEDLKRAETELSELNAELDERVRRRTAELEAANKELEAFTYSVSHDLRAPLRHISGFSKILTEEYGPGLAPEAQHHLQRIQEGTFRMGLLVDDLLNLGRVGRHEVRLQVTGLNSIVNEVVDELKLECEGRQVEWKLASLPFVECDPALMKQVFQNLLSNAVKFTRPRSPAVIEVGQKDEEGTAAVFIRDNGVGFNMKYADKLFGVFQRLHRAEDFEGTGVGLATVQRIVQKHGGRIWAEAELDKGATFFFTLGTSEKTELKTNAAMAGDEA